MDSSPEYVQMCRQAKEIQEQWKPQDGDFYEYNFSDPDEAPYYKISTYPPPDSWTSWRKKDMVWIVRQDQLQAILDGDYRLCNFCTLDILFKFVNKNESLERCSMEQVWLAFVMSQKYNKIYNGSEWVAE